MESGKSTHKPIRMCIVCKGRFFKEELYRMQCYENRLIKWRGVGRSFYVCKDCVNNKKFIKYISKKCNLSKERAKEEIFHFPFFIVN